MDLLILIYFIYSNSKLARSRGKNSLAWGFITFLAFLAGYMIGLAIIMNLFYEGSLDPKEFPVAFQKFMLANQIRLLLAAVLGIGAAILVRYTLEKQKPIPPDEG